MKNIGLSSAALLLTGSDALAQRAPFPTNGWSLATPAAQMMNGAPLASLHARIANSEFGNVSRLVVTRNGYLVANHHYCRNY
jgi:hypothetical protein